MKNIITSMACCLIATTAVAQETYESAQIATQDLNGTARYIGMGGAMEALGADISTISTNPAGLGMFRKSWVGLSGGMTAQRGDDTQGVANNSRSGVTNADFNQIGIVYSMPSGRNDQVNFAFNYHKSRNFNQVLNAGNMLNDASASKTAFISYYNCESESYLEGINSDLILKPLDGYSAANRYGATAKNSGYAADFDFSISGSINNRLYLGLAIAYKRLNFSNNYYYDETLVTADNNYRGTYYLNDERKIKGSGYDVKFGAIVRPIEDQPFRVGIYVNTPTWYTLTSEGGMRGVTTMRDIPGSENTICVAPYYSYDYKIVTPWKFGLSFGHTVDQVLAIGATYEFADYSSIKNKVVTDSYYDYYYDYWYDDYEGELYNRYGNDKPMNDNTDRCLKGVHTVKVGLEAKPVPDIALRIGYNYISPVYESKGGKDYTIDGRYSNGAYFSNYGYTNWKDTHRVTLGLGFTLSKSASLDLSYQLSTQRGDFHPFQTAINAPTYQNEADGSYNYETNIGIPSRVKNNRHQVNATLGFRF